MSYDEVMLTIEQSNKDQWVYNDHKGIYTYKPNVDIRIEEERGNEPKPFCAKWANEHLNPSANQKIYSIYYNCSFIKDFILVSVDGGRAMLPIPEAGSDLISKINYQYASIIDEGELDDYITRSNLKVTS